MTNTCENEIVKTNPRVELEVGEIGLCRLLIIVVNSAYN